MLKQVNWNYDLYLPSIVDVLPHVVNVPKSLQPDFKWSRNKSHVPMIIGIPTVKREKQSYLDSTLKSIFGHISVEEAKDVLVILMIAEPNDIEYIKTTALAIRGDFSKQMDEGLLEIIAPPSTFYPDFSSYPDWKIWRSKQNLDHAYLMMYAKQRGSAYYVQLTDDIVVG